MNQKKIILTWFIQRTGPAIDGKGDGLVDENENTKLSVLCIKNEQ